eukprot:gene10186-7262_t
MKSVLPWVAKTFTPNYFKLAKDQQAIQMVTISFSHYCELAVWALEKGGKKLVEHDYAPGQHALPVMRVRVYDRERHFSQSSRLMGVKEKETLENCGVPLTEEERKKSKRRDAAARATAVPVAVLPDGRVLTDSWELAEFSGLPSIPPDLKVLLDNELGPLNRQAVYSIMLKPANIQLFHRLCTTNRHWLFRSFWHAYLGNYVIKIMKKVFRPFDEVAVTKCKGSLQQTFDRLDRLVADRKGTYLLGDELSLADIALASLAAPILLPPLYCGGKFTAQFQELYLSDPDARGEIDKWRSTITGQYVMKLYADHRVERA